MINTEHWTICREFSIKCLLFQEKINSFMVLGECGTNLLIVTEDGNGYFYNEAYDEPILWNILNIVDAAQGEKHALILDQEGKIFLYGGCFMRTNDQIETNWKPSHKPVLISSPHKFISVKCGIGHCLALTKDGKVFGWGNNESCQVGHCDDLDMVLRPHFISELDQHRIVAIDCGGSHSLALTDDGQIYAWGSNSKRQIGMSSNPNYYRPLRMKTFCAIKAMAAGHSHTLLLSHDGLVYACGSRSSSLSRGIRRLHVVVNLPLIYQIGSHSSGDLSIAVSFNWTCFVWGINSTKVPLKLPMSYSTIDSAMALFSSAKYLPNLVRVQETKLSNCLARMFDNPESSDVQFVVEDQIIHGHRSILRNASGHLDQMFSTSWCSVEPTARIVIADR